MDADKITTMPGLSDWCREFLAAYAKDDNHWWRTGDGEHQGVCDQLLDALETAQASYTQCRESCTQEHGFVIEVASQLNAMTAERDAVQAENTRLRGEVMDYREAYESTEEARTRLDSELADRTYELKSTDALWVETQQERDRLTNQITDLTAQIDAAISVAFDVLDFINVESHGTHHGKGLDNPATWCLVCAEGMPCSGQEADAQVRAFLARLSPNEETAEEKK